jgi:8-oxo-dGTP pyrophosphatase MutT (NUDIX family)
VLPSDITTTKTRLTEALKSELPGEKAHIRMLPKGRGLYPSNEKHPVIQSSVLMLLFPFNGLIHTCLIRRPSSMTHHGGQIAFPGGKFELSDKELSHTALRESFEEIGTDKNTIEILGALTPLYIQVSNFKINPFIGWSNALPQFMIDKREVDELFKIPVEKFLQNPSNHLSTVNTSHGTLEVPGYEIDRLFIWGATAMIISEFNEIYKSIIAS